MEALTLARPEGYVQVFADEGAPLAGLLDQVIAGRHRGTALAAAFQWSTWAGSGRPVSRAMPAPPRSRPGRPRWCRRDWPSRSPAGSSRSSGCWRRALANKQIARELVVTLETAKKHVSHVLGKLGAANRAQAVARARDLGLLR